MTPLLTTSTGFILLIAGFIAGARDGFILAAILIIAGCAAITYGGSNLLNGKRK